MLAKNTGKRNPYLNAIIATISYIVVFSIVRYARSGKFSIAEVLLGAAIFCIIYLLAQRFFLKRAEKRKR